MKKIRGQFFTVNEKIHEYMLELMEKSDSPNNTILEPSAGAGDLLQVVSQNFPQSQSIGWEIDPDVQPINNSLNIQIGDFFEKSKTHLNSFDTIIGNPPYVAWKNVEQETKTNSQSVKQNYSDKTNLYYLFVDRCIDLLKDDGEIIFIQPKEWMYSTSAAPLRKKILETGTITHIIDGGEEKVFPDADVPAIMIFRYQKTKTSDHSVRYRKGFLQNISEWETKDLIETQAGYWMITDKEQSAKFENWNPLSHYYHVKVGIVSGADKIFNVTNHEKLDEFIEEGTALKYVTTKGIEHFIDVNVYQEFDNIPQQTQEYLLIHKESLINRKIISFGEHNWWKYGAIRNKTLMDTVENRIYTFAKTRSQEPFFVNSDNEAKYFSGGLLALFAKDYASENTEKVVEYLNSTTFRNMCEYLGLTTANKVSFQPLTLGEVPFPPAEYFDLS